MPSWLARPWACSRRGALNRAFISLVLVFTCTTPLQGQKDPLLEEVSAFVIIGDSENPELPNPLGLGVRSTWNISRGWLFRLSLTRVEDQTRKYGVACVSYAPHIACRETMTDNEMALTAMRGSLLRTLVIGRSLRLGFGGGLTFNNLAADSRSDDGARADLLAPNTGQVGFMGLVSAELILHPNLPVRLTGGLTSHLVKFHTCSGATPPQYDPFCKLIWFREGELGLTVPF